MAQKDHPEEGPTLELPSLFRRKKKTPQVEAGEPAAVDEDLAAPVSMQTTEVLDEPVDEPADDLVDEPVEEPVYEPVEEPGDARVEEPVDEPGYEAPLVEVPTDTVATEPEHVAAEPPAMAEPAPVEPAVVEPAVVEFEEPEPEPEPEPLEATTMVEAPPVVTAPPDAPVDEQPHDEPIPAEPEPEPVPAVPKPPLRDRIEAGLPDLAEGTAAAVVGAVVGLLGCVATFLSLKGCELATGTSSCGGPGLLVLIVILVAMIMVGALLLRLFRVPEAGNLSFLGVAITSVVILVFLIKYLFSPWMFAVVPVLSAFSFALARWVTTRWTDDGDGDPKTDYSHDVR